MNKIFCLGDGYAHGHIWPEWPQILKALATDYDVIPITGIGTGNEFLINQLLLYKEEITNQKVIFQWAAHNRFDKLVQNSEWRSIAESDPVYHFNFYKSPSQTWWLSSASELPEIKKYHNFYIEDAQSLLRYNTQQILIENYLKFNNCKYYFTSTENQSNFSRQDRFMLDRGKEIQPSPIVHLFFVIEILLPAISLSIDKSKIEILTKRIHEHKWIPYDPDRDEIWNNMVYF